MRIRTIKPEFWTHESLCQCSDFTRLLAIAILNLADDEGYFMANPHIVRGSLFPFLESSKIIPGSLHDLSRVGWIELGKDDQGRDVGRVVNFAKHQRVDKPKPSQIKACSTFPDASQTHPRHVPDASKEERKGKEGKGTEEGNGMGVEPPRTREAENQEYWPDPREYPTVETVKQWAEQVMVSPACAEKWHATRVSERWETRNQRPLQLDSLPALFRTYATAWKAREAAAMKQTGYPNGNKPRNQALPTDVTRGKTAEQIGTI